jgi:hypothetical protein
LDLEVVAMDADPYVATQSVACLPDRSSLAVWERMQVLAWTGAWMVCPVKIRPIY